MTELVEASIKYGFLGSPVRQYDATGGVASAWPDKSDSSFLNSTTEIYEATAAYAQSVTFATDTAKAF